MTKKRGKRRTTSVGKRGKYAAELAKIKELRALDSILKKGDIENALLSNAAKEQEPVSETVIDSILDSVNTGRSQERDLEVLEKLTEGEKVKATRGRAARKPKGIRRVLKAFRRGKPKRRRR